jgi:hypothetical protein
VDYTDEAQLASPVIGCIVSLLAKAHAMRIMQELQVDTGKPTKLTRLPCTCLLSHSKAVAAETTGA